MQWSHDLAWSPSFILILPILCEKFPTRQKGCSQPTLNVVFYWQPSFIQFFAEQPDLGHRFFHWPGYYCLMNFEVYTTCAHVALNNLRCKWRCQVGRNSSTKTHLSFWALPDKACARDIVVNRTLREIAPSLLPKLVHLALSPSFIYRYLN